MGKIILIIQSSVPSTKTICAPTITLAFSWKYFQELLQYQRMFDQPSDKGRVLTTMYVWDTGLKYTCHTGRSWGMSLSITLASWYWHQFYIDGLPKFTPSISNYIILNRLMYGRTVNASCISYLLIKFQTYSHGFSRLYGEYTFIHSTVLL